MPAVLCVCLGNICRSPLAEGILKRLAQEDGFDLEVDSAGTGDWHVGQPPDERAVKVGIAHGCDMSMRARQFSSVDFKKFDLILVMDHSNLSTINRWSGADPSKVRLVRSFDPSADGMEVPDPYYGSMFHFEEVADMLEVACRGVLKDLQKPSGPARREL